MTKQLLMALINLPIGWAWLAVVEKYAFQCHFTSSFNVAASGLTSEWQAFAYEKGDSL